MTCYSPSGHCDQTVCEVEGKCAWPESPAVAWSNDFGDAYTARNRVNWRWRLPFWRDTLARLDIRSLMEVGCNAGWNLTAIRYAYPHIGLHGVDVNNSALNEARAAGFNVNNISAQYLVAAAPFDLVMTVGMLIHVPPEDIKETMESIVEASGRYVLAVEYFAEEETEIEYRGQSGMLWKRNYGKMYADMGLNLIASRKVGKEDGFDDCTWWLLEKIVK